MNQKINKYYERKIRSILKEKKTVKCENIFSLKSIIYINKISQCKGFILRKKEI